MNEVRKASVAPGVSHVTVDAECAGQRLDNFLASRLKGVPKSHLYRIVRAGEVRVNGRRVDASYRLAGGDELRLPPVRVAAPTMQQESRQNATRARRVELPVLFEDEALMVINKPAGLAVHGGSGLDFGLIEALRAQRPDARFLELAHRLDRETSGILLIGKRRLALKVLHDMFRQGLADKRYLALVAGRWNDAVKDVRMPLRKFLTNNGERRVTVDGEEGRFAHTIFRRRTSGELFSLIEAQLKTGRTHQIRVHLAQLGYPIAGDDKYGDFTWNRSLAVLGLRRMFLHAWRIRFPHPVTGAPVAFEAPLPGDLDAFLARHSVSGVLGVGE